MVAVGTSASRFYTNASTTTTILQPTLLDCWACRDLKRFRAVLKGSGAIVIGEKGNASSSPSHPRSPAYSLGSLGNQAQCGTCPPSEVNRRDHLGRTVLHLIATSSEPVSIEYLTALLAHPSVNLNLQDHENGWTPLHRALYHGNLLTALTLLKRFAPADIRVKDFEGLTPFDLYNSTIHGTNPTFDIADGGELLVWGANRNYTLGLGNSDDRALPDRVTLRRNEEVTSQQKEPGARFDRIKVKDVAMNKFATIVLTAERSNNVWVCGIGTSGRIGRSPQTQVNLEPLRDFPESAASIAVGPDHTCVLTSSGDVYTFGYNRFHQLGYTLENGQGIVSSTGQSKGSGGAASATFGAANAVSNADLDVQITPRKVLGQLKREQVLGMAAGKLHTVAFTSEALYSWGTNTGQLGYDRAATPVQITPRKVTMVSSNHRIQSVAVTDFATACLLTSGDVLLLHNDTSFFIRFPQPGFSSDMSVFRPRQARPKPSIHRLVSGPNNAFAAISDMGDVWQFSPEHPSEYAQPSGSTAKANVKPQLIWSVRKNKKIGAAKDVALGAGSDLILVTESGHVFVRSKKAEIGLGAGTGAGPSQGGAGGGKGKSGWRPVPFIQRVTKVATNESGGFAAIKSDAKVREIRAKGRTLSEDLQDLLPHLKAYSSANAQDEKHNIVGTLADATTVVDEKASDTSSESDSDVEDSSQRYISMAQVIAEAARRWLGAGSDDSQRYGAHNVHLPPFGCDMFLIAGNRYLPAHRTIISARLPSLGAVLQAPPSKGTGSAPQGVIVRRAGKAVTMTLEGCSFGTALFLLHYLYTDDLPPVWTASVALRVEKLYAAVKLQPSQIHTQLKQLAVMLGIPALRPSLDSPVPRSPAATLSQDLEAFFRQQVETAVEQSPHHDVVLHFSDRIVPAHSALLRRSPFFAALFQPEWTSTRWSEGVIAVDMAHVRWQVARIVLLHLYTDGQAQLFAGSDEGCSPDQFIDFVMEVLALSTEMLLSKFKQVCSSLLRRRLQPVNVASLLTDADFYNAVTLREAIMDYIAKTMETLLESGMLDALEPRMIKDLTRCVRDKQDERMHRKAREDYMTALIKRHQEYFADLDLPPASLGIAAARVPKRPARSSPILAPSDSSGKPTAVVQNVSSTTNSPYIRAASSGQGMSGGTSQDSGLLMFSMDDDADGGEWQSAQSGRHRGARSPSLEESAAFSLPPARRSAVMPWKSRTVEAEKASASPVATPPPLQSGSLSFDLRSIMAAEQSRKGRQSASPSVNHSGSATPTRSLSSAVAVTPVVAAPVVDSFPQMTAKLSQRDRKRQVQSQSPGGIAASPPVASAAVSANSTSTLSPWSTPAKTTPLQSNSGTLQSPPTAHAANATPSMGPTYTPTRMMPRPPPQKRVASVGVADNSSGNSVWSAAAVTPVSSPSARGDGPSWLSSSPSPHPLGGGATAAAISTKSFAEIQAEELQRYEHMNSQQASSRSKSFAQLQEEDRLENEKRKEEERKKEEFERWFEQESRRIRQEGSGHAVRGKGRSQTSKVRSKGAKSTKKEEDTSTGVTATKVPLASRQNTKGKAQEETSKDAS